jgi:hypothetical protein
MMFGAPTPTPAAGAPPATGPVPFPSSMPSLDPPPIPQMPGFAGPATFAGPAPNPSAAPATDTGPSAKDVIARLAKPTAAPGTEPKPKPKKSPVMLIVGVGGLLALFVLIFFFLHDRRGLKSMVSMGGDQKPIGSAPVEEPKPVFTPKPQAGTPSPEAKPQSAQPATLTGGGTAAPSPAPVAGDKIPDAGETAIALVKNTPLMGDRGSVGQWLSYSYNADGGSKEDWTAGAVDATSYAVEYKVKPGPNSTHKEVISYLFEADTARKTVKGTNQAARSLLSGGTSAAPKKAAKPVYKRKARAKPSQAPAPKKVEQLPLPTDNELLPPAEDDANFKSDTVQPGL